MAEPVEYLGLLYETDEWPGRLRFARGAMLVASGHSIEEAAKAIRSTKKALTPFVGSGDPVERVLGASVAGVGVEHRERASRSLGTLLLGRAAEVAFEDIYKLNMHTEEVELEDLREGRTDTDYVLLNGKRRKILRLNIKFFGSYFRRAADLVYLETDDCFPLATYKINAAVLKQTEQHLPFVFLIVGVKELNAASLAETLPSEDIEFLSLIRSSSQKELRVKDIEDRIIQRLAETKSAAFVKAHEAIKAAPWYVLSAKKADDLLRSLLFERVFAVRIKSFTNQFPRAEVDMHFSLSKDLLPLPDFFQQLKDEGLMRITARLTSGDI